MCLLQAKAARRSANNWGGLTKLLARFSIAAISNNGFIPGNPWSLSWSGNPDKGWWSCKFTKKFFANSSISPRPCRSHPQARLDDFDHPKSCVANDLNLNNPPDGTDEPVRFHRLVASPKGTAGNFHDFLSLLVTYTVGRFRILVSTQASDSRSRKEHSQHLCVLPSSTTLLLAPILLGIIVESRTPNGAKGRMGHNGIQDASRCSLGHTAPTVTTGRRPD